LGSTLIHKRLIYNHPVPKFEECLQRLEQIVDQLEKGDIPLEQALALFEEGMKLSNDCRSELETAEGKVEILLKQGSKIQPEPFDNNAPDRNSKK
jgi:exodeoxyribonuclease VII small subunit